MKSIAEVQAGVCGFTTTIEADAQEEMVSFTLTTDCEKIQSLANALQGITVDAYDEVHRGHDGEVMRTVRANLTGCCAGCAVPVGIFKAMQVAAQVALPKDVSISLKKE